jgi:hypothetical protein
MKLGFTTTPQKQSKQWTAPGEQTSKRQKLSRPQESHSVSFWDAKGILLKDYLEKGKTTTGESNVSE